MHDVEIALIADWQLLLADRRASTLVDLQDSAKATEYDRMVNDE